MQQFITTDASGTPVTLNGAFDSTGGTFTAINGLVSGTIVETVVAGAPPISRSVMMPSGLAQPVFPVNPTRRSISFQVPLSATSGVWVSWTGAASVGAGDSFFFPAGTLFVTLDVSVTGLGVVSIFAPVGGFVLAATEC